VIQGSSRLTVLAGPTAVHVLCDCALATSCVKMRNETVAWSAADSPRPVPGSGLSSVSDQVLSVPAAAALERITSVHFPLESLPLSTDSGSCGLKREENGAAPF